MIRRHTSDYNFIGLPENGLTFRWGRSLSENPENAPWPELADISITSRCTQGCGYCYKNSKADGKAMSLQEYRRVLDALEHPQFGNVFQVALGGGEPLEHPMLVSILEETSRRGIVPNYTTSGYGISRDILEATARFCGAVAVSYDPYREVSPEAAAEAVNQYAGAGIKTNVHFVVSRSTLKVATRIVDGEFDSVFAKANAVVFLLFKPVGRGPSTEVVTFTPELWRFLESLRRPKTKIRVGCDACMAPILLYTGVANPTMVDTCEAGFFSLYVDENMVCSPCSFCTDPRWRFDLRETTMSEIWDGCFGVFRSSARRSCTLACTLQANAECRGGCPLLPVINLCPPTSASSSEP